MRSEMKSDCISLWPCGGNLVTGQTSEKFKSMKRQLLKNGLIALLFGALALGLANNSQAQLTGSFVQGFSYTPTDPVANFFDTIEIFLDSPPPDSFVAPGLGNFDDSSWSGALLDARHLIGIGTSPRVPIDPLNPLGPDTPIPLAFDLTFAGADHAVSFDFVAWDGGAFGGTLVNAYRVTLDGAGGILSVIPLTEAQINFGGVPSAPPLLIAADNQTRFYGDANPTFTVSYTGFTNGDTAASLAGTLGFSFEDASHVPVATIDATTPPGSYFIVPSGLTSANYSISFASSTLAINPAGLTVTANNQTRTYGAPNPALTGSVIGLANGDAITATFSTVADANSPVGSYPITSTLSDPGNKLSNYALTTVNGALTVTPALLLGQADNKARPYGATNPVFSVTYSGFVNGQNASVVTGPLIASTPATTNSPVGGYPITVSGQSAPNYTIQYFAGLLDVTQVPLLVRADDAGRAYGQTNPIFTATYSGFVNGEGTNILIGSPAFATIAQTNSPVGQYPIIPSGLAPLHNYALSYSNGTLTITPFALLVNIDSQTRTYGATNQALTGSVVGLQAGDVITATFSTVAVTNSPVGSYPITVALADPGGRLIDYTVTTNAGTLTVTPAALIVTADNQSRPYGASNPALTGTLTGVQNGDNITASFSTVANALSSVGGYPITSALSDPGSKLGNYAVTSNNGTLTVTTVPLTAQADSKTRGFGTANPVFTGTLTGVLNGDNLTATFNCAATPASVPGTYPIIPALVDPNNRQGNYAVTLANGILTVTNVVTQRTVLVADANSSPGALVDVAVNLSALGDENTVAFSLAFDPTLLSYVSNTLGSAMAPGSTLVVNTNPAPTGSLGVLSGLPTGAVFPAGIQQLALFTFRVSPAILANTNLPVSFTAQPAAMEVGSVDAQVLPANFVGGTVSVFTGFEADVSPRSNGDGRVTATDWTLIGRYVAGLSTIADAGEFMRADCAPRGTSGDGRISATDWTQAGRYVVGLDPLQPAGGPTVSAAPLIGGKLHSASKDGGSGRLLRLVGSGARAGATVQVPVELVALGNENTAAFSVAFDPAAMDFVSASPGNALAPGAAAIFNTNNAAAGRLGVLLGMPPGQAFTAATQQVLVLTLKIRQPALQEHLDVAFGNDPVLREIGSVDAEVLSAGFVNGAVTVENPLHRLQIDVSQIAAVGAKLSMAGLPGRSYQIQGSTNLLDWTILSTVTATPAGLVEAVDATAKDSPTRFYRALAQ